MSDVAKKDSPPRLSPEREAYWRRRLGRLRLGYEPLDEQLTRQFRVTLVITGVISFWQLFFLALFSAFGRPDIGLLIIAIGLVPIEILAWLDYRGLARKVAAYRSELEWAAVDEDN